jgi:hypothetical protein
MLIIINFNLLKFLKIIKTLNFIKIGFLTPLQNHSYFHYSLFLVNYSFFTQYYIVSFITQIYLFNLNHKINIFKKNYFDNLRLFYQINNF